MDIDYHWMMACNRRPHVPLTRRREKEEEQVQEAMKCKLRQDQKNSVQLSSSPFSSILSLPTNIT